MHRRPLILLFLVAMIALYVWAANRQSLLVNTNMHATDQSAYMDYAKNMARTDFQYVGGRNRMPIYPGLMALFYREGMSDEDFFRRGKNVGILLGLGVLSVAFVLFTRVSTPVDASVATLVTMFTVFAFKAPYFQAEVLFYGMGLVLFYLLLSLIRKPRIRTAVFAGIAAGIAHLTKASVLPALLLAGVLVLIRGIVDFSGGYYAPDAESGSRRNPRILLNHTFYMMVMLACFLVVVLPYIRTSKARFGRYFYNVNSTFYMWYDSWAEVIQGTRAHGDRRGWPDMPEEQIPSMGKYIRDHSVRSIGDRLLRGFLDLRTRVIRSYGYAEFLMVYGVALLVLFVQNAGRSRFILQRAHPFVLLFILGYFFGYTLLYAWYTPLAEGNRFVLALFLPAMLVCLSLLNLAHSESLHYAFWGRKIPAANISFFVLLFLFAYLMTVFPHRVSTLYGGG